MSKTTRLLSLILVIAMAFSLVVSGASAAWADDASTYPDYDTVNYEEAVKVLTYLNIIEGIDGSFKPEGNLQRDAAAKIVTLVVTAANDKTADTDQIAPTNTDFSDVPKTHWASGYIQWAYKNNIINGQGDMSYGPSKTVTILQFMKMLLTGLGYGANGEFTGSGWDTATYVKATELGLWGDVEPVTTDRVATREEAMEFALQALKKAPVHYAFNAYAVGSLLNVNSFDLRPLYERHGLALDAGVDKIGYLTYQWRNASNNDLVYEGYEAAYRTILVTPETKRSEFESGIVAGDDFDLWINGFGENIHQVWDNEATYTYFIYESELPGGGDPTKVVGWKSQKISTLYNSNDALYKYLYETVEAMTGAKVTLYVEDRELVHVTIEVQFVSEVSNVKDASKTFTATTADKFVGDVFGNVGCTFTGVDLDGAEYKNKDIITIVPQFSNWNTISKSISGRYPKAVLKTYATGKASGYGGYTTLLPYVLKFTPNNNWGSYTWAGSINADTVPTIVKGSWAAFATYYTDSNGFVVRVDEYASALPNKFGATRDIVLAVKRTDAEAWASATVSTINPTGKSLYPAVYDFTSATYRGEYQALHHSFKITLSNARDSVTSEVIVYGAAGFGSGIQGNALGVPGIWGDTLLGYYEGDAPEWKTDPSIFISTDYFSSNLLNKWYIDTVYNAGSTLNIESTLSDNLTRDGKGKDIFANTTLRVASDCVILAFDANYKLTQYDFVNSANQKILNTLSDESEGATAFYLNAKGEIGAIIYYGVWGAVQTVVTPLDILTKKLNKQVDPIAPAKLSFDFGFTTEKQIPGNITEIEMGVIVGSYNVFNGTWTGLRGALGTGSDFPGGRYTIDVIIKFTDADGVDNAASEYRNGDGWWQAAYNDAPGYGLAAVYGNSKGMPTPIGDDGSNSGQYSATIVLLANVDGKDTTKRGADDLNKQRMLYSWALAELRDLINGGLTGAGYTSGSLVLVEDLTNLSAEGVASLEGKFNGGIEAIPSGYPDLFGASIPAFSNITITKVTDTGDLLYDIGFTDGRDYFTGTPRASTGTPYASTYTVKLSRLLVAGDVITVNFEGTDYVNGGTKLYFSKSLTLTQAIVDDLGDDIDAQELTLANEIQTLIGAGVPGVVSGTTTHLWVEKIKDGLGSQSPFTVFSSADLVATDAKFVLSDRFFVSFMQPATFGYQYNLTATVTPGQPVG